MDRKKQEIVLRQSMVLLGKKIKEEREKRGWDYLEIIIRSGVSNTVIYNLEAGLAENITMKSLIGLADAFEVNVITLIGTSQPLPPDGE